MMKETNHIHKLKRHRFKTGNLVYFCVDDTCRFKCAPALALGKKVLCWRCGEPFNLSEYSIRLAKPHCDKCHKPKSGDLIVNIIHEITASDYASIPITTIEDSASSLRNRLASSIKIEEEDI